MAPEVIKESRYPASGSPHQLNPSAADLWSFGITLIELLKGRPPLHYLSPSAAMGMIPSTSPPRLESTDPHASKLLRDLIHACLHDDPQKRPTAKQLLKQYKNYFKAQKGQQSNILYFLKHSKKSVEVEDSTTSNTAAAAAATAANGVAVNFSTVLSGWDFEIGSAMYADQESFETTHSDSQAVLSHSTTLPGTPKDLPADFAALTPFHDRPTPTFPLRSVNSDSLSLSLSLSSTRLLDDPLPPQIPFKGNCSWNRKDKSLLPTPPPLQPPDLSRPQYEIVARVSEANSKEQQILRLMRLYLTEEDRRGELSLQLRRMLM
jgi:serine/threonine protein kinase